MLNKSTKGNGMLKSIEKMAREKLENYMRPLVLGGSTIHSGWPAPIAAKKAAAAYPQFEKEIYKIAGAM